MHEDQLGFVSHLGWKGQLSDRVGLRRGELTEGALHAERGAHGADGIVLGDAGHAEGGDDAVAEQLDDGAALRFNRGPQGSVIAVHQTAGGLRVETFVQ